ncbi:interleukin-1 receptor-associated kinase 1-binding protein 1 homolog [Neosynchiropus ocellatus]
MDDQSGAFTRTTPHAVNDGNQEPGHRSGNPVRKVMVTGTAEVCYPADRATLRVSVGSSKDSVDLATSSVSRRLEYILQTLRQHDVSNQDTTVRKLLHREENFYKMDAEVTVTFSDFEKMERINSVLLEKLDRSVTVGVPQFFHSAERLSQLRERACVAAVESAQQKASKVSQLLGQTLGSPQLVTEEETKEWRTEEEDGGQGAASASRLPYVPKITVSARVSVCFGLRDGRRKKL